MYIYITYMHIYIHEYIYNALFTEAVPKDRVAFATGFYIQCVYIYIYIMYEHTYV